MKFPKGLLDFLKKTGILILIISSVISFIMFYFRYTPFFKKYLSIPSKYSLNVYDSKVIILICLIIGFVTFMTLIYKKIVSIPVYPFRKKQLLFLLPSFVFLCSQYLLKYLIFAHPLFFAGKEDLWALVRIALYILSAVSLLLAVYGSELMKHIFNTYKKEMIITILVTIFFFFFITVI